jgi:micrococcal nuclease
MVKRNKLFYGDNLDVMTTAKRIAIFALLVLSLIAGLNSSFAAIITPVTVQRVIDGDTVEVDYFGKKESVRLIGVDTPETKHPTKGVQPYGREASVFTKSALEGRNIWLEFDVEQRDRYGRLLAYVWTSEPSIRTVPGDAELRSKMFNARLLLDGYAQIATFPPNVRYVDYFKVYQTEARENGRGLWGQVSSPQTPKNTNTQPVASGYIGNRNSKIFHVPSCSAAAKMSAKNRVALKGREEAMAGGYRPCKICKP